ncbi:hypothetical protein DXG03_007679 [Asterophora parasitica]|uniref:Uncharacterized protein n=1 Tax=Asterophora parasitica TaxID=117018 RepID=A0A9P7KAN0_9AGAR|nr:hypothetical protein DXG03_007679 [Asterophora parasitica]
MSPIYSPGILTPQLYYSEFFSPTHSAESSATLSTSTSSSLFSDDIFITDDPKYREHSHLHQSQIRVIDDHLHIHVSPFNYGRSPNTHVPVLSLDTSYPTIPNMYGTYSFPQPISPSARSPTKTRTQARSASRHKAINYRSTIHDQHSPAESPVSSSERLPSFLPPKPTSLADEKKKKNFFPISWRVIGGGVLMGEPEAGSKTPSVIGDYDARKDDDEVVSGSTPENSGYPGTIHVRSTSLSPEELKPGSFARRLARTRSNSSPPTPTTTQVNVDSLFSAESPGHL